MYFCPQPFDRIEIYEDGRVFNCCPPFVKYYCIGNIYDTPFDEIWNGEKVRELRRKILKGDFSYCDDTCNRKMCERHDTSGYSETAEKYPASISVSSDNICNVKCRICRDEQFRTPYDVKNLEAEIENIWLPIFKDAELLRFGCSGEPFASQKETMLIKKSAEKYPDLKFHFHTNGILADEKKLKELGVFNKIDIITLSLHSASPEIYNKIVKGGNWDKVFENIKLYAKMKKENLLNQFRMIFVVFDENYTDMEKFVKLAQESNAIAEFWALRYVENTEIGRHFKEHSIVDTDHKLHGEFVEMLKNPIFRSENVILYPELKNLI